jgi:hypothetical protein
MTYWATAEGNPAVDVIISASCLTAGPVLFTRFVPRSGSWMTALPSHWDASRRQSKDPDRLPECQRPAILAVLGDQLPRCAGKAQPAEAMREDILLPQLACGTWLIGQDRLPVRGERIDDRLPDIGDLRLSGSRIGHVLLDRNINCRSKPVEQVARCWHQCAERNDVARDFGREFVTRFIRPSNSGTRCETVFAINTTGSRVSNS